MTLKVKPAAANWPAFARRLGLTPRGGWPLPHIPAGREGWVTFLTYATDEQVEQALIAASKLLAVRNGRDPGRERQ